LDIGYPTEWKRGIGLRGSCEARAWRGRMRGVWVKTI